MSPEISERSFEEAIDCGLNTAPMLALGTKPRSVRPRPLSERCPRVATGISIAYKGHTGEGNKKKAWSMGQRGGSKEQRA